MSEEKLYAVKDDEGKYFDCEYAKFLPLSESYCPVVVSEDNAKAIVHDYGGHVVVLTEEPKKVVLSEKQAKIVEDAHDSAWPAGWIDDHADDIKYEEELLMNAYVNGYTVAKEKKYNVKVPHAEGWYFQKYSSTSKLGPHNNWKPFPAKDIDSNMSKGLFLFTESEIEHYGLQDCQKEEVKQ
jgi:hypothetical protein